MTDTDHRITLLERRHEQLETRISRMQADSQSDSLEITDLKKQKLACKDEITQLLNGK